MVTDNGGDAVITDFPLFVGATGVTSGVQNSFAVGSYTISETGLTGYTGTISGDCASDGSITLNEGDVKACTITNDDQPGTLTVTKVTIPENTEELFSITATGNGVIQGLATRNIQDGTPVSYSVDAGTYSVTEGAESVWDVTGNTCVDVVVTNGDESNCTITNTHRGHVTVIKYNDHNGNGAKDEGDEVLGDTGVGEAIEATRWEIHLVGTDVDAYQWTGAQVAGQVTFSDILPTTYTISEQLKAGWVQTNISCESDEEPGIDKDNSHSVSVDPGETTTCYIGNQGLGTIIVEKEVEGTETEEEFNFEISDGDELIETIGFVLGDGDSTDPDYSDLPANTYSVSEEANELYTTTAECVSDQDDEESVDALDLNPGETITCTFTNTRNTGTIIAHKIIDADGDLQTTEDQYDGEGWEMDADGFGAASDFAPQNTGSDGTTTFSLAKTGSYNVRELQQEGYELLDASCDNGVADDGIVFMSVAKGETVNCTFINSPNGTIHGYKWSDDNGDSEVSEGEDKLSGWTINLYRWNEVEELYSDSAGSFVTDAGTEHFGWYWFEHLLPGKYQVCETPQAGWEQTYPLDPTCHFMTLPDDNSSVFNLSQNAVFGPDYNFGNQAEPSLTLEKKNDASGTKSPGDTVLYTLTIALTGSALTGVQVTDVTPEGFEYVLGSWTSSKPGVLEPTYGSPGVWNLGNMNPGDVVTLTYLAKIKSDIDGGNYLDTAWAQGESKGWGTLLAQGQNSEYVDGYFVGTDVAIGQNTKATGSVDIEGEVLGASTELPATGADSGWLLLALGLLLSGLLMIFGGKGMKKITQIALILVIGHWSLVIPPAMASDSSNNLSTRLESPLSPTRDNDWLLSFSILDRASRIPSVTCYVKKPGEGSFNQFDSTKVSSKVMGDNMSCHVDASLMSAQGNYEFYVVTTAGSDSEESAHVTVTYDTEGPDRPASYTKEHPWACRYTIKFKTANDGGKTTSVEVFGSKSTSFNTDNSTRIGGVSIGSNQEGSLNHDLVGEDCNQTWYYVIRAFDSVGNQSAHLGDEVVTISTSSSPAPVSPALVVANTSGGSVLGEEAVEPSLSPTPSVSPSTSIEGQGLVAGASEAIQKTVKNKSFWWIVLIVIALRLVYGFIRHK